MYKYEKKQLEITVKDSLSIADVCRKLNIRPIGGNYKTLKIYFRKYNIDISHFTGQGWNVGKKYRKFGKVKELKTILIKNSTYSSSNRLKKRLINDGYLENKCSKCGLIKWNDEDITLHLDHINGDNLDHRIENLRILCPNCHSQTNTYCKGTKSSLSERRKKDYEKYKDFPVNEEVEKVKKVKQENFCKCGKKIKNTSKNCIKCSHIKSRKVKRPPFEQLKNEIKETSYLAVGKKYGVSDNAVRKWLKK